MKDCEDEQQQDYDKVTSKIKPPPSSIYKQIRKTISS